MNRAVFSSWPVTATLRASITLLTTLALLAGAGCSGTFPQQPSSESVDGEAVYGNYCANCHGPEGDGQGPAAYLLFPKPRNFQRGDFKLRSTPQGMLPTDEDLMRTVTDGIPGTSMFSFGDLLTAGEMQAVVEYVKSLTPAFEGAAPISEDQLLQIPSPPPPTPVLIAAGRQTYEDFGCAQCHGPEGRGDGPSAPTLRDREGDPFPAADFTYGIYKGGGKPKDLYRTFLAGMMGTPMPSYASALQSQEQAWGLVYYVLSLAPEGETRSSRGDRGPVAVASVADRAALDDPWSPDWDAVPPHRVALRPLWYRNDYPPFANVRAARAGERLAVLLEWQDSSRDTEALHIDSFADGVAVQFALVEPPPFVGMGGEGSGGQVEIWYWRGDRQAALERGAPAELTTAYPHVTADRYPFVSGESADHPLSTAEEFPGDEESPYAPGRDVGNAVSTPELLKQPVHSLAAAGFGTLTSRPFDQMRATGRGVWSDGVYRVVFSAPLRPAYPGLEADFTRSRVPMAVAMWNGSFGDRDGTKLVSQWVNLDLAEGQPAATAAVPRAPTTTSAARAPQVSHERRREH